MWTYADLAEVAAGQAGKPDAEVAAALETETIEGVRDIPCAEIETVLLDSLEWGGLQYLAERAVASDETPKALIGAAMTVVRTIDRKQVVETTQPARWALYQQMVGLFESAGVIAPETAATLLALRTTTARRWHPAPTADDVTAARKMGK